ncbi:MAG: efflux RND transporter periplasmic adaptor subunit [Methylovulum sp.]
MIDFKLAEKPKWLIPVLAIFALMLMIFYALGLIGGGDKISPGVTAYNVKPVPADAQTLIVGRQTADNSRLWPGVIHSRTLAKIAPKLTARIVSVNVNSGDRVKKGQILARLDEREMRSAYLEASAALNAVQAIAAQAQADVKRSQELYDKEAVTRASHDAAIANARSKQAAVNQAASAAEQVKVNLGENSLLAPFDGVVSERLKEPGDMGVSGEAVVILLKPDDLRLEVALADRCASRLKVGQAVRVRVESTNETLDAKVDEILPEIDRQTGTQLIKAALPKTAGLQHGQFAWLEQSCDDSEQLLLIPTSAVLHYGQLEAVRIVADNQVYTRHIRTGKQQGDSVEVLSGLREGETIIIGDRE